MRTAVVSDVHANLEALDAVLTAADDAGCARVVVLGDIVGYGADPDAVIGRLTDRDAVAIAGNHDLAAVGGFEIGWFNDAAAAAIRWTRERLSPAAAGYLSSLAPIRHAEDALLVHGSVRDPIAEYLLSAADADASFSLDGFPLGFFGHTHLPTLFTRDGAGRVTRRVLPEGETVTLDPGARYLVNPGSVGQPRDRDPRAAFLVWDGDVIAAHRVVYPVDRAAEKIRAAGLPAWLADRLAVGE